MASDSATTTGLGGAPSPARAGAAGRPRSEQAHRAILCATLDLLGEVGLSALTVEGVAARAGVGKATIYRRWKSKLHLATAAIAELPALEEVDTGSLAGDLEEMLLRYLAHFTESPLAAVLPSLAGERAHDPEFSRRLNPLLRERRQPLLRALRRAVERGELPADTDLELAADVVVGPMNTRFMFGPAPTVDMIRPMVRAALWGMKGMSGECR